ncbi:hypothetical protein cgR_5061 [Corynebacterium glutamicum R]|uniref:Uncharacterized protein n=1 Tax=Corynebacterium glutamicum (strain R) TaxID=340322 RepID=A0AB72VE97_CORGB|nr:hypothetical protein cgR_5061 [Corynebacterium glutamicum R]
MKSTFGHHVLKKEQNGGKEVCAKNIKRCTISSATTQTGCTPSVDFHTNGTQFEIIHK